MTCFDYERLCNVHAGVDQVALQCRISDCGQMDESLDGRGRHQSQPTVTDTMRLWVGKWKHCKNYMESAWGERLWKYRKSLHYFVLLGIVSNLRKKQKRVSSQGALCQDRPCFGGPVRFRRRRFSLVVFVSFSWQAEQEAHQETISEHGEMMEKHQVQGWGFLFQSLSFAGSSAGCAGSIFPSAEKAACDGPLLLSFCLSSVCPQLSWRYWGQIRWRSFN